MRAVNFIIHGNYVISGYGFTAEKDYLYVIEKHTGEVAKRVKVASGPDYLIEKDDQLYVRTYNTDYLFSL